LLGWGESNDHCAGCEIAQALMDQMRQEHVAPDKLTYTTMITIYSRKGWHKEAIETFEQMQLCGCVPERSTYNTILSSYSRFGMYYFLFMWYIQSTEEILLSMA
jgi:pentatricopeptide repeat protein